MSPLFCVLRNNHITLITVFVARPHVVFVLDLFFIFCIISLKLTHKLKPVTQTDRASVAETVSAVCTQSYINISVFKHMTM